MVWSAVPKVLLEFGFCYWSSSLNFRNRVFHSGPEVTNAAVLAGRGVVVLAPWKLLCKIYPAEILHSEIPFRLFLLGPVFSAYTCEALRSSP